MMKLHTKPWKHQFAALKFLMSRNFGALYTDMGSGKTKVMIDLIVNSEFKITLIVMPKKVCREWPGQFIKHAPNEHIHVIDLSNVPGDRKVDALKESALYAKSGQLAVLINYDSIWRRPFKQFLLKFPIDCVICDESHRIKSPGSKTSRMLTLLGKRVKNRFLMTGTPMAQNPLDVYAQYRFLEPSIFGTRFDDFKMRYANLVQLPGTSTVIINKRHPDGPYKNLDELREKMFSCAFQVENLDQSLPPTQDITVEFELSSNAQKLYKALRKDKALELEQGDVTAGNVLAVITRLQQLTSGYLPVEDEYGEKKVIEIDRSRQEALRELLEDLPSDEPVVIFTRFKKDIKNIRRLINEMGRKSSELSGARDTLHNWRAGKTQYLVVQISAGAEGIDLTRARYNIYYTMTQSLVKYKQSRKRSHRPGQTRPVIYYKLVARLSKGRTIDQNIIRALDNNEEIIESIMSGDEI